MPASPSATPRPWRPRDRAASDAAYKPSAVTFATAWTAPTRSARWCRRGRVARALLMGGSYPMRETRSGPGAPAVGGGPRPALPRRRAPGRTGGDPPVALAGGRTGGRLVPRARPGAADG